MAQQGDSSSPQGPGIWPGRGGAAGDRVDGGACGDHSQARADSRTRDSPGRWDARRWAEASGEGRHRSPRACRMGCSCSAKGWMRGERLGTNLLPPQELTGILPAEYPFRLGEKAPKVRRRIGAAYKLDEWALHREVRCCRAPSLLPEAGGCGPQALLPLCRGLCSSITQLRPLGSAWTRGTRLRVAHVASGRAGTSREDMGFSPLRAEGQPRAQPARRGSGLCGRVALAPGAVLPFLSTGGGPWGGLDPRVPPRGVTGGSSARPFGVGGKRPPQSLPTWLGVRLLGGSWALDAAVCWGSGPFRCRSLRPPPGPTEQPGEGAGPAAADCRGRAAPVPGGEPGPPGAPAAEAGDAAGREEAAGPAALPGGVAARQRGPSHPGPRPR